MSAPDLPTFPASQQKSVAAILRAAGCVFAEDEARLLLHTARSRDELDAMVDRRVAGEPLEPVLGWAEFCGLRIHIDSGVFVPRRRTEFLAWQACSLVTPGSVVVDMCCGSGAVGAVLQSTLDAVDLYAVDVEPAAVRCARRNITPPERVLEGDLFEPLPTKLLGRVDVVVANAPYVPTESIRLMPPEARLHEPLVSLDGGTDGLDLQRRIIADAAPWLRPGGCLLVETSTEQVEMTVETFTRGGFLTRVATYSETASTVVIGQR
ncbi:methylase [Prescottella equi]|jgi:release factor glutamine methyltransferase|uniref:putative protein N(5)-glutamine methyltransferase n=1 Tax=Rhodococcus TaxID=1827 RepID=UPI0004A9623B|nr:MULTISPECIES: putative protein N(5)-glutamine methyltransferase [Rhodococcus]OCC18334.1 methylase [Prescottella equi]KDQ04954.1 methylase [Rhodococcus qingshengii]KSU75200.1 methylase [Rhodococcus qingshengii]MBT9294098.1 putative protein N(5)-glutamine methyltransferase [Rhodococcus sp. GOMB7]MBW0292366.1 methylase [Rhodococcus sp. MH15]